MKIKKTRKIVFKKQIKIVLFSLLLFFAAISFYFLYTYYHPKEFVTTRYNYKTTPSIDYKVYLKQNDYYEEEYMSKDKQYTAELIDYVDIDFGYLYTGSNLANLNYTYDIDATIVGEYENTNSETPVLWTKKYDIKEEQKKFVTSKTSFNIKENVKVNYDDYNRVVDDFKTDFKLAILAHLNVKINIKYDGVIADSGKMVSGSDSMEINIPLSKTTVAIDTNIPAELDKYIDLQSNNNNSKIFMYVGYGVAILDILLFIVLFDKLFIRNKNVYVKKLEKILKDYADITIRIVNKISFEDKELIEITSFNDMLDIEEEFNSPIMVYESIENRETWFILVNDNYAYRYVLNIFNAED